MKLSIFFEIQIPKPWTETTEYEAYWNCLELVDMAEQLGFDTVWLAEHHLLPEWSHSSAPEVFLGALSQRTSRIKLGHGVVLLPRDFNHIIRVAERTAALDILSNGRLQVGTGRSVTAMELLGFEIEPDDSTPMWDEALHLLPRLWTEETVSFKGKYYNIPEREVVPKPIQKPHPPLWVAGTSPGTYKRAGERGIGMIGFPLSGGYEDVAVRIKEYRDAIKTCKPAGKFVNNQVATLLPCYVHEDDKRAKAEARRHDEWVSEWSGKIFSSVATLHSKEYAYYEDLMKKAESTPRPTYEGRLKDGALIAGDPQQAIDTMERYVETGTDQILCWFRFGGVPHEQAKKSLQLIGEKVLPRFHQA